MLQIHVDDRAVQDALAQLTRRMHNLQPILKTLGEDLIAPLPPGQSRRQPLSRRTIASPRRAQRLPSAAA